MAIESRPGLIASTVAIAAAVTDTWRSAGTSTAVPSPMRSVRSAACARPTHTSV